MNKNDWFNFINWLPKKKKKKKATVEHNRQEKSF